MRTIEQIGRLTQDNVRVVLILEDKPSWEEIKILDKQNVDMHCTFCNHSFLPCEAVEDGWMQKPTCPNCQIT